ncbi:molybdate transport system permease protein [Pedobacter cryoconitis]|uniref:Molybdenum transport system permease n=1 Tax=Pedobacter cryoconitis TaxID=188932 RepID=A0A7W9E149_9SPHI|nr:molybdate ABC transporter permease subunit [Pedobacter cryoconitis]MBB5637989.1 molybdate transport system permease protein [Pedobacter cryoconitis]MBB6270933.1 molybdate transport system permease protein [Pedobacter cryoconitis]
MEWTPIWLSLKLAACTTLILFLIGIPLAYWLSRRHSLAKVVIEAMLTMPLVLPPSVLGFYLLLTFSPNSLLGSWLHTHFNISLVFSFEGLVVASVIYSLPFMVSPVKSALAHLPVSLAEASYTMGKSKLETFYSIQLPNIKSSLWTATVLTFAHTLGEFGVVLMIGGKLDGVTKVASIAIYDAVDNNQYHEANLYSLVLFAITFVIVILVFIFNRNSARGPLE